MACTHILFAGKDDLQTGQIVSIFAVCFGTHVQVAEES